jgi:hypothetical protein
MALALSLSLSSSARRKMGEADVGGIPGYGSVSTLSVLLQLAAHVRWMEDENVLNTGRYVSFSRGKGQS